MLITIMCNLSGTSEAKPRSPWVTDGQLHARSATCLPPPLQSSATWTQRRSLTQQGSFSVPRCPHAFQINVPPTDTMQRRKSLLQSLYPIKMFKYNYTVSEKIWTKCKGKMYTNFSSKRNYSSEISQLHKELAEIIRIRWQSSYPD